MKRRRTKRLRRPRLEALEARWCPCSNNLLDDGTLLILGDEADNHIDIVSDGRDVIVQCDRDEAQRFQDVKRIEIRAGTGNDVVTARLHPPPTGDFNFNLDLGDGDDQFRYEPPPEGDTPPPIGDFPLLVEVMAGAGNDVVTARLNSPPEPEFIFRADLGDGDDRFDMLVRLDPPSDPDNPPPDPDFPASFEVLAGSGDDQVNFTFFDIPDDVRARVDLGAGNDSFVGKLEIVDLSRGELGIAQIDPGNFVGFDVLGRDGNDRFQLDVGSRTGPSPHILNSDVAVEFDGGADADAFDIFIGDPNTSPEPLMVNGSVAVNANGSDGSDNMVIAIINVAAQGNLDISAEGGLAEDHLEGEIIAPSILSGGEFRLSLDGQAGRDVLALSIPEEGEIAGPMAISLLGGAGSDLLSTFVICPCILPGGRGQITVDGQGGNDTLLARIAFTPQPEPPGSPWLIRLNGSEGTDLILSQVEFQPPPEGDTEPLFVDFRLQLDGGAGADLVALEVGNPDERVNVRAVVELFGGLGNDLLALDVAGQSNPNEFEALVDGGDGFDIAFASRGVLVRNCELVFFPPGQ